MDDFAGDIVEVNEPGFDFAYVDLNSVVGLKEVPNPPRWTGVSEVEDFKLPLEVVVLEVDR